MHLSIVTVQVTEPDCKIVLILIGLVPGFSSLPSESDGWPAGNYMEGGYSTQTEIFEVVKKRVQIYLLYVTRAPRELQYTVL